MINMNTEDSKLFDYTPAQLLHTMMMKVTTEDPLQYLDQAYASVNPGMLKHAIELGRSEFQKMEKKTDQKRINCYHAFTGNS